MAETGSDVPRGGLTYADYVALPDDGQRYQLVEGELVVTPSPTSWHQSIAIKLGSLLLAHVEERGLGIVLAAPLDVRLDDHTVVQPDLLFVAEGRRSVFREAYVDGAPDLCVEILSPGTERFDRVRKLEVYARFGVAHYWIVDPQPRTIEEHVLSGDVFRVRSVAGIDDGFRPALFPDFEFRLSTVRFPCP
jgi:Uma2 family endonuclease